MGAGFFVKEGFNTSEIYLFNSDSFARLKNSQCFVIVH